MKSSGMFRTVLTILTLLAVVALTPAVRPTLAQAAEAAGAQVQAQPAPQAQPAKADDFDAEYKTEAIQVADPFMPWNKCWFYFNDTFYQYLFRPIGKGYNYVVPEPARTGLQNFFHNLGFPIRFVNCVLQGEFSGAGVEFSRFAGNTVFGLGGLVDVTKGKKARVEPDAEDFGQTLGVWGMGEGCYIVWPFIGPSSLRDTLGLVGDTAADPVTYISGPLRSPDLSPWWLQDTVAGSRYFVFGAAGIEDYDSLRASAVEPYTAFRNAYIQNRREKVKK